MILPLCIIIVPVYMKKLKNIHLSQSMIWYLIIGLMAFFTEYLSFTAFTIASLPLVAAQSVSFLCGLLVSFVGNRKVTFNNIQTDYVHGGVSQLWRYVTLALINFILSNIILYCLVNSLSAPPLVAKLIVMAMVVAWNYLVFSKLIFRTK